jgi:hypothetical protein
MTRIELLHTHTHRNAVYPPGSHITVDETTARWLIERGIGRPVADSTSSPPSEAATPSAPSPSFPDHKPSRKPKE